MNKAAYKLLLALTIGLLSLPVALAGEDSQRKGHPDGPRRQHPAGMRPAGPPREGHGPMGPRHLTPEQRQRLRQRLAELRQRPGFARNRFRKNLEAWRQMDPEQRRKLRARRQWLEQLPPEKRQRVIEAIHRWRAMSPEQRQKLRERLRSEGHKPLPFKQAEEPAQPSEHSPTFPPQRQLGNEDDLNDLSSQEDKPTPPSEDQPEEKPPALEEQQPGE